MSLAQAQHRGFISNFRIENCDKLPPVGRRIWATLPMFPFGTPGRSDMTFVESLEGLLESQPARPLARLALAKQFFIRSLKSCFLTNRREAKAPLVIAGLAFGDWHGTLRSPHPEALWD